MGLSAPTALVSPNTLSRFLGSGPAWPLPFSSPAIAGVEACDKGPLPVQLQRRCRLLELSLAYMVSGLMQFSWSALPTLASSVWWPVAVFLLLVATWWCVRPEGAAPASPSISSTKVRALLPVVPTQSRCHGGRRWASAAGFSAPGIFWKPGPLK
jgi:hypothetical protein